MGVLTASRVLRIETRSILRLFRNTACSSWIDRRRDSTEIIELSRIPKRTDVQDDIRQKRLN